MKEKQRKTYNYDYFLNHINEISKENKIYDICISNNTNAFETIHNPWIHLGFYSFILLKKYLYYPVFLYNDNIYIVKDNWNMNERIYYFMIPYFERKQYVDIIYNVNKLISSDGLCEINVDNTPYNPLVFVAFDDNDENIANIKNYLLSKGIVVNNDKTIGDLLQEKISRQLNSIGLNPNIAKDDISYQFSMLFYLASSKQWKERGYKAKEEYTPKVFISYSWKDSKFVDAFVDEIMNIGIHVWFDKKDIEGGEQIVKAMMNGIDESDIGVFFISENYKHSLNAQSELITFFTNVIQKQKQWRICRLDNVNPNDIIFGLNSYKYYDWSQKEELIQSILRGLEKIKKRA